MSYEILKPMTGRYFTSTYRYIMIDVANTRVYFSHIYFNKYAVYRLESPPNWSFEA